MSVFFLNAIYISLKRNTVQCEVLNITIRICSDGRKEVLNHSIVPVENNETWNDLLKGLVEVKLLMPNSLLLME